MNTVYLGLGSNLENPAQQVTQAVKELQNLPGSQLICCSSWYASVAVGPPQPDYINGVVCLQTTLEPIELLDAIQAIEQAHHRVRKEHWGARTLDIDILLWNKNIIDHARLQVPHPYLTQRNFVLLPLHEIAPALELPCKTPLAALIAQCSWQGIRKLPKE